MKIYGIGTDIANINRIKISLKKKRFYQQNIQQNRDKKML